MQKNLARLMSLVTLCSIAAIASANTPTLRATAPLDKQRILDAYGKQPLSFEINRGQTAKEVKFLSRGSGYNLFLTAHEAVLTLTSGSQPTPQKAQALHATARPAALLPAQSSKPAVLRMKLLGANTAPQMIGENRLPGTSNYYSGQDRSKWHTDVVQYAKVRYQRVYPGIDLVYYGNQKKLEYDFMVAPGADPQRIRMDFQGAQKVSIDPQGNLVLYTGGSHIVQHAPVIYQEVNGQRQTVAGHYKLLKHTSHNAQPGHYQVGFQVAAYDTQRPLIIDPVLVYSTYLGGSKKDIAYGIAIDPLGNACVVGTTQSADFPSVSFGLGIPPGSGRGQSTDVFVAKLSPLGILIFSTYIGGSDNEDGKGITVDGAGDVTIVGRTDSADFPTQLPLQAALRGGSDAFVTKLGTTGQLLYSTYLGGSSYEDGCAIASDALGNTYVAGDTYSGDFPTVNPLQANFSGQEDGFVAEINPTGTKLVYATYLGGSTSVLGIAVDSAGDAYVTGSTGASGFPLKNPIQSTFGGISDAFVAKLNSTGTALFYSTFIGGSGDDEGHAIAVDSTGAAYVTGTTSSIDFPTMNAFQPNFGGGYDAFVTKLNPAGSAIVYSTYLGGANNEYADGIAVDNAGEACVTGSTSSNNFPTQNALQPTYADGGNAFSYIGDAFITKFSASGSTLVSSTYLGGATGFDAGHAIAEDKYGDIYVAGETSSTDFPRKGPVQLYLGGFIDAFVTLIIDPILPATPTPPPLPTPTPAPTPTPIAAPTPAPAPGVPEPGQPITVTFSGQARACAGAIADATHRFTLQAHSQYQGDGKTAPSMTLNFAFANNVGHDYGNGQPPKTAKFINSQGQAVDTLSQNTDIYGNTSITVQSSDVVSQVGSNSQPKVVVTWSNINAPPTQVGSVGCDFGAMTSVRGSPDPIFPNDPNWQANDTGWLFDRAQLDQPGDTTTATAYLKFMINPTGGTGANNLEYVNGHQLRMGITQVTLWDGTVITDPTQIINYVFILNPGGTKTRSALATTGAVPNAQGVQDGAASITLTAGDRIVDVKSFGFAADEHTQWNN